MHFANGAPQLRASLPAVAKASHKTTMQAAPNRLVKFLVAASQQAMANSAVSREHVTMRHRPASAVGKVHSFRSKPSTTASVPVSTPLERPVERPRTSDGPFRVSPCFEALQVAPHTGGPVYKVRHPHGTPRTAVEGRTAV